MVRSKNFSGNKEEILKAGKEAFMNAHKGKYAGDLETLWNEISGESAEKKPKIKGAKKP